MMYGRISTWGIGAAAIMLAASCTNARAQEDQGYGSGYSAADQSAPQKADQPQMVAADSPNAAGNAPPNYGALPPAANSSDADLTKRVADLEDQLAKMAAAAKSPSRSSGKPLIAPSGRIQLDTANFTQNPTSIAQYSNAKNSVGFRRARIALLGEYEIVDYIIEMDFANRGVNSEVNQKDQSTAFKDVYIQVRDLPMLGNVRAGHFKECFGLEDLTSDNYTTFMERSLDDEGAFCPGRNDGIMAYDWTESQRATWAIGTFTNATGFDQPPTFIYDHWGLDMAMRATYLPWYDEASGGRGLLHTGIGYVYRSAPDHTMTLATRPESAFAPSVINMTLKDLDNMQNLGVESALVYGPLSVQSEFFASNTNYVNDTSNKFWGTYVFVSYFLTGENRPYNRKLGVFDRVKPFENFFRVRTCDNDVATGRGAWEVAYRFSYIDMLDDLTTKGAGIVTDHTFGVNWYLNPYTRLMFNYVHSIDTYNVATGHRVTGGNMDILEMRCAMDF
jgi:phosphate-selective porin OprO and OprP